MKQKTVKLTQTIKPSQFLRRDGVIDNADAKDTRTITVSFASEEPYERGFGIEILQVDNTALTMDRFANGLGCLLYNHNRDVVLGHIDKDGIIVRYDRKENDFVKVNVRKGIVTMFKPRDGEQYYTDQKEADLKHGGKS